MREVESDDPERARRLASAVLGLVITAGAICSVAGILLAPSVTTMVAAGFEGPTRDLTIRLVRILFPMSGLMVVSAWCLGILNTHGRFFLSYAAPVMWNTVQIAVLVGLGGVLLGADLAVALAWGALAGGLAQVVVQWPWVLKSAGVGLPSFNWAQPAVKLVIKGWLPVVAGAGVMQISSIIDTQLGSLVGPGAVVSLGYAQLLQILPISVFGIAVAAVALPELSRDSARLDRDALSRRLSSSQDRVLFFILPSAFALAAVGDLAVAMLYEGGRFDSDATALVAAVVAAYAVGLPGHSLVKLLASGHWAMNDTKTPVLIATGSLTLSAVLAFVLMRTDLGVAGIAAGSSIAVYFNIVANSYFLRRKLSGSENKFVQSTLKSLVACGLATGVAIALKSMLVDTHAWVVGPIVLGGFGVTYVTTTAVARHPEALALARRN